MMIIYVSAIIKVYFLIIIVFSWTLFDIRWFIKFFFSKVIAHCFCLSWRCIYLKSRFSLVLKLLTIIIAGNFRERLSRWWRKLIIVLFLILFSLILVEISIIIKMTKGFKFFITGIIVFLFLIIVIILLLVFLF